MDENYAVMYRNEQVGKLQMQRQGLYCRMQCRCQLPGDDISKRSRKMFISICVPSMY